MPFVKVLGALLLALIAAVPIGAALLAVGAQMLDASAWQALWADPQTWRAWGMTLWTGLASTALAWITVAHVLASGFIRQQLGRWLAHLPALLATPHAAMAIGLVLWLSPSGWALRLVSPGLTGFDAPPPWFTTQDPWGLGLILALWLKEVPFLLWVAATQMQREDLRRRWQAEYALAQTLGRTPAQAFAQIIWTQLAPRLRWPLLAKAVSQPHPSTCANPTRFALRTADGNGSRRGDARGRRADHDAATWPRRPPCSRRR